MIRLISVSVLGLRVMWCEVNRCKLVFFFFYSSGITLFPVIPVSSHSKQDAESVHIYVVAGMYTCVFSLVPIENFLSSGIGLHQEHIIPIFSGLRESEILLDVYSLAFFCLFLEVGKLNHSS